MTSGLHFNHLLLNSTRNSVSIRLPCPSLRDWIDCNPVCPSGNERILFGLPVCQVWNQYFNYSKRYSYFHALQASIIDSSKAKAPAVSDGPLMANHQVPLLAPIPTPSITLCPRPQSQPLFSFPTTRNGYLMAMLCRPPSLILQSRRRVQFAVGL